jgi:hypothetical protein
MTRLSATLAHLAAFFPAVCLLAAVTGCQTVDSRDSGLSGWGDGGAEDEAGGGDDSGDGGGDGDGGDGGGDGGGDDGDGDDLKYDVANGDGEGGPGDEEDEDCGKVDFLFVVDNSPSTRNDQEHLIANYPSFIDGIKSTLPKVDDYQVGVVTTDALESNVAGCNQIGGLVVQTPTATCGPYARGGNYMTVADNLDQSFACAAGLGETGAALEKPMLAMETAVRGDLAGPGECNEGFLRPDSLLIIVIVTDEGDGPIDGPWGQKESKSGGGAPDWYDTVVNARGGIETNIVVLSLIQWLPDGECDMGSTGDDGHVIKEFTEMFTYGFVGRICDDFAQYFDQAIALVGEACDGYMPPEG